MKKSSRIFWVVSQRAKSQLLVSKSAQVFMVRRLATIEHRRRRRRRRRRGDCDATRDGRFTWIWMSLFSSSSCIFPFGVRKRRHQSESCWYPSEFISCVNTLLSALRAASVLERKETFLLFIASSLALLLLPAPPARPPVRPPTRQRHEVSIYKLIASADVSLKRKLRAVRLAKAMKERWIANSGGGGGGGGGGE